jgi:hypothetical protein
VVLITGKLTQQQHNRVMKKNQPWTNKNSNWLASSS